MLQRIFILLVVVQILWSASGFSQATTDRPLILQAAELTIGGKTNINTFTCRLRRTDISDTLEMSGLWIHNRSLLNGLEINFLVSDFECDLSLMTKEFRQLLKFDRYPNIKLVIEELKYIDQGRGTPYGLASLVVSLHLAGESSLENIKEAHIHRIQKKVILSGIHKIAMTVFDIEPPTKMFGAVRAEDMLEINFAIQFK